MSALPAVPDLPVARLVVLDEEPLAAAEMAEFLRSLGHTQVTAMETATPGLVEALRDERPDLLLLELGSGGGPALGLLEALQADRLLRQVPVLATQAEDLPAERLRALQLHAADVLRKPLEPAEFALRLRNLLWRKQQQDRLAFTDGPTGLPSREWALRRLDEAIRECRRYGGRGAVLQVGLERFRQIIDALGLALGDALLREVGQRLGACVRDTDLVSHESDAAQEPSALRSAQVARGDGDEFTVLLPRLNRAEQASSVAQRIVQALRAPFLVGSQEVFVTCRVGIAVFPDDATDKDGVLERAILAMRHGPGNGNDGPEPVRFYSKALHGRFTSRLAVERELHHALERRELQLYYQPKVSLADGRICGAEALLRWQHPQRGRLGPGAFIEVAEESGLIVPLGEWVLREAIEQMARWRREGLPPLSVAVNVSSVQLRRPGLAEVLRGSLHDSGLDGRQLCLELTESAIMDGTATVADTLAAIRALGVRLALDDFGTGYSSLSYLRRFPLDELKIDRSFIAECTQAHGNAAVIVRAIIALAHGLGLRVVAEGIETQPQLDYLRSQRCDEFQGFLYSAPVPPEELVRLLQALPAP